MPIVDGPFAYLSITDVNKTNKHDGSRMLHTALAEKKIIYGGTGYSQDACIHLASVYTHKQLSILQVLTAIANTMAGIAYRSDVINTTIE